MSNSEKEFTSKTIFIERFDQKRLDLKSLFNHCTISEETGTKMLKLVSITTLLNSAFQLLSYDLIWMKNGKISPIKVVCYL